MNENFHAVLIAGTHSSAGKTTWSLALMALARKKGLTVQPFKAGPDYIDPGFHHEICSPRRSRNLDLFFLSKEKISESFHNRSRDTGLAIVEGVMGLYDGKGPSGTEGSSAELAKILRLPVLLVIDGSKMAGSAAALVSGFKNFDPAVHLAGVLINRVRPGHFHLLKRAIELSTGLPCLGFLPEEEAFSIPERHLGLTPAAETQNWKVKIDRAASFLEKNLDWDAFLRISTIPRPPAQAQPKEKVERNKSSQEPVKIGVARDAAFSFYYEDNLDLLNEQGAEILFFSPLKDPVLPEGLDFLYLGGGFPEIYAQELAKNESMIKSVRDFYARGGFIYGECGGLIYLAEAFCDSDGTEYPLLKLLPGKIAMTRRLQNFGYHEIKTQTDTFLFSKNTALRSHEFHYSIWNQEGNASPAYQIGDRPEGFASGRIFASYQHLHFGLDSRILARLFESLKASQDLNRGKQIKKEEKQ